MHIDLPDTPSTSRATRYSAEAGCEDYSTMSFILGFCEDIVQSAQRFTYSECCARLPAHVVEGEQELRRFVMSHVKG